MRNKKKKKLGSFPYLSVVFSITLALFLIGLLGIIILHASKLSAVIRENVTMQVYLHKNVTENDRIRINKLLSEKEYVARKDDNPTIMYISRDDAAKTFASKTGDDFVEFLGENPLRDAFIITIHSSYQNEESMKKIQNELSSIPSVYEVAYTPNLVQSINENAATIGIVLGGIVVIVLITIVILINNTIKLALFSQRFLIRSMQLVGAKIGFIIWPFVRSASIHGLVAGILASLLLIIVQQYAYSTIKDLREINIGDSQMLLYGALLFLGVVIGALSTFGSVKRYLKMSLNELY